MAESDSEIKLSSSPGKKAVGNSVTPLAKDDEQLHYPVQVQDNSKSGQQKSDLDRKVTPAPTSDDGRAMPEDGSESKGMRTQGNQKHIDLLKTLGLTAYFPCKLSLKNLMSTPMPTRGTLCARDLPWLMLWKLIMVDFNGRDCEMPNTTQLAQPEVNNDFEDSNNSLESLIESVASSACSSGVDANHESTHPSDVFLALFSCCDLILRQTLVQKMYMCRVAVPFLVQDALRSELQMCQWSLRTIVTEWRDSNQVAKAFSIVDHPMHIVSFIKIHAPSISKSNLLNGVISDDNHPTFFHRDRIGGMLKRQLANGIIEASWRLPSRESGCRVQNPTMFLNLRGSSTDHLCLRQLELLTSVSSAIVVFVEFTDLLDQEALRTLKSIHCSQVQVLLLITCAHGNIPKSDGLKKTLREYFKKIGKGKKRKPICCFRDGSHRSIEEITREIRSTVVDLLDGGGRRSLIEVGYLARKHSISIDEDDDDCKQGNILAEEIRSRMKGKSLKACKTDMLSLQGVPWLTWCAHQRKQLRSDTKANAVGLEEKISLQEEKLKCRKEQLHKFKYTSQLVRQFMKCLIDNKDNPSIVSFFLQWLRMYFDKRSRETLPALRQQYSERCASFRARNNDEELKLKKLKQEVDDAGKELLDSSFGLEHLLREAGQVYEAAIETNEQQCQEIRCCLANYPSMAAKLLLQGQPIEIMDGNASVVPLCWIKAILSCLREMIGVKTIFVISVLGVQSSGKSTLLNTMFGLQFPVSAGRCTRGLYMQLFEVTDDLPYEFVMVIDTEGLRAPEELGPERYDHDNELATLVIGLGDITILNIQGENIAEMKDVLQIAIHAFLRMKNVSKGISLQQSCIFTHQNVAGVAANEQMMQGKYQLLENLDEITKQAAIQVNMTDNMHFRNVINFDEEKHVWCFPCLWLGEPPMAPTNPGYSERVREVRDCIMNDIALTKQRFLTVGDMEVRIEDLWKGIQSEDFVFSFRCSLSIKAYVNLEDYYRDLLWKIKNHVTDWLQKNAEIAIKDSENKESLRRSVIVLEKDMRDSCSAEVETCLKDLDNYFQKDNLSHISIQWKEAKVSSLRSGAERCLRDAVNELNRLKHIRKVDLALAKHDREMIQQKARQVGGNLKARALTDTEIDTEFRTVWEDLMSKTRELKEPMTDYRRQVEDIVESVLNEMFTAHESIHLRREIDQPVATGKTYADLLRSASDIKLTEDYLSEEQSSAAGSEVSPHELTQRLESARQELSNILRAVENDLKEVCSQDTRFQRKYAEDIVKKVGEGIEAHNRKLPDRSVRSAFRPNFKVKLAVHVCRYATESFIQMQQAYDKKHGLLSKLAAFKKTVRSEFENTVRNRKSEIIAADLISESLKKTIERCIEKKRPREMVKETCQEFNNQKYFLMTKVLEDLIAKDDFFQYNAYIQDSATYVFSWIRRYMEDKFFPEEDYGSDEAVRSRWHWVSGIFSHVEKGLSDTLKDILQDENPTMARWQEIFASSLQPKTTIISDDVKYNVTDFEHFHSLLEERLISIKEEVIESIKVAKNIKWEGETPYKQVFDRLWGCKEQCPFCKAPCRWGSDHTGTHHQALQHRPEGVIGQLYKTKGELLIETCNYNIQSKLNFRCKPCQHLQPSPEQGEVWHPYRNYHTYFESWDIAPNPYPTSNAYWMWFMAKYLDKLTWCHLAEDKPKLPECWYEITKEQAIQSLREFEMA